MKVAIIGWGSLIWDKRELEILDDWIASGGPVLPIEFSRVSKDLRLSLVIDYIDGVKVKTRYAISAFKNLDQAIENLYVREGSTTSAPIGYVNLENDKSHARNTNDAISIRAWAQQNKVDATIWSDFQPNFKKQTGCEFSIDNAVRYLVDLPLSARENAFTYIRNAPEEVDTPLRRRLSELKLI